MPNNSNGRLLLHIKDLQAEQTALAAQRTGKKYDVVFDKIFSRVAIYLSTGMVSKKPLLSSKTFKPKFLYHFLLQGHLYWGFYKGYYSVDICGTARIEIPVYVSSKALELLKQLPGSYVDKLTTTLQTCFPEWVVIVSYGGDNFNGILITLYPKD